MKKGFFNRNVGITLLLFLLGTSCGTAEEPQGSSPNPNPSPLVIGKSIWNLYGCYFRHNPNIPTDEELKEMAQFRAVILDIELCDQPIMNQLKQLNPWLVLGCYVNPQDIFVDTYLETRPWQSSLQNDLWANYDQPAQGASFFLYDITHQYKQKYWLSPPMYIMNLSISCPRILGVNYAEYIAAAIIEKLFTGNSYSGKINFVVVDNALRDYAWMSEVDYITTLDANWNGINDFAEQGANPFTAPVNVNWRSGISLIIDEIINASPVLVIGNQPNDYYPQLSGKQFEGIASGLPGPATFKLGALTQNPADALMILEQYLLPKGFEYNIIQAATYYQPSADIAETAIAIAMLEGSNAVTFQFNTTWRPEIAELEPGEALGAISTSGVFRVREFTNCWIVFNTGAYSAAITLANSSYTIPPYSGRVIAK